MEKLTIKEIADLAGVTKPAIRYKADKLGINLEKDDSGKVVIGAEKARKILDSFTSKDFPGDLEKNNTSKVLEILQLKYQIGLLEMEQKNNEELIKNLRGELAEARQDLKSKDELIKQATNQLATLADQAQKLQLRQIEAPRSSFWARFFKG